MNKFRVILEHWRIQSVNVPTKEDFFQCATDNPNGMDGDEEIAIFNTKEEALAELAKYKCSYEIRENYNESAYELYAVEEIVYDDGGDIEDYRFIKYADIEIETA